MKAVEATVDRISTADLMRRYNLKSRTGLANRLNALGIEAYKEGKSFFVPVEAINQLDALAESLKRNGAKLDECAKAITEQMNNGTTTTPTLKTLPNAIAQPLVIQLLQPSDRLDYLRSLTEASDNGWHLPTSLLLELMEMRSLPRLQDGIFFIKRGFVFTKMPRNGRESEWRVTKS